MIGLKPDPRTLSRLGSVSRETLDRLVAYVSILAEWQSKINLIGPSEIDQIWDRHIVDCGQLAPLLQTIPGPKADLGSGAGFPGLVLAILGIQGMTLVESNSRKCVFLRQAARATETPIEIFEGRAEKYVAPVPAQAVTARALAPLDKLFGLAHPLLASGGNCLFLKGRGFKRELTESQNRWHMNVEILPSISDPSGCILIVKGLEPIHENS
ncbi:MAG: 16S rRNA (guanine(527)-N(7))-methyltransferase RsmG [Pseudomonadota bacterium]|nr:16S rRNA (guanine(527)-N(7))-methyltransferase RsmG [Pseudomonadota bacterium]